LKETLGEGMGQIVIWNSFEFSAYRAAMRARIAEAMIALRNALQLSVLVFSHGMRHDVKPCTPVRGAIGLLSAYASFVFRLMSEIEWAGWRQEERKGPKSIGIGEVHESRMDPLRSCPLERGGSKLA